MTYQIPETLAKQVIERLTASQINGTAVWFHTAYLSKENKHPRKMNMIAHLLMPLTQNGPCRTFFLSNNDILLVGMPELRTLCLPIIEQLKQVLSDDPLMQENPASFYTIFSLKEQKDLVLSALTSLTAEQSLEPLKTSEIYPLLQSLFKKYDLTTALNVQRILQLTPSLKKHIFSLCTIETEAFMQQGLSDLSVVPTWMKADFTQSALEKNMDYFSFYNTFPQPLFIPLTPRSLESEAFTFFMQNRISDTSIAFHIADFLRDSSVTESALKKCHRLRHKWVLLFDSFEELSLIDFTKIKPDFICVSGQNLTFESLPIGLKKETIVLTQIENETALFEALRKGFTLFQGPLIETILGTACQKECPYGDTCSPELCANIAAQKTSGRACVFPKYRTEYTFEEQGENG